MLGSRGFRAINKELLPMLQEFLSLRLIAKYCLNWILITNFNFLKKLRCVTSIYLFFIFKFYAF